MIKINHVSMRYGEQVAIDDISFCVKERSIHGLIGENGSGKTTLLKCLAGIYKPCGGSICYKGSEVYENPVVKEKIGYVSTEINYVPMCPCEKLVNFYEKMFDDFSREKFMKLNEIFEIDLAKAWNKLSKGQCTRLIYMLNIARNPKYLILDEPFDGLDVTAKKNLVETLITEVENNKLTVLISAHQLADLEHICDDITLIQNGKLIKSLDMESFKNSFIKLEVNFKAEVPINQIDKINYVELNKLGSVYSFIIPNKQEIKDEIKSLGVTMFNEYALTLEEVYLGYCKGEK